jgi:hypothetical protein
MDNMKAARKHSAIVLTLPCIMSVLVAIIQTLPVTLVYIASLLFSISIISRFRKRESISMFAVVSISSIPANIGVTIHLVSTEFVQIMSHDLAVIGILWGILIFALLFSLEQIFMGIIVRMLWPIQLPDEQ